MIKLRWLFAIALGAGSIATVSGCAAGADEKDTPPAQTHAAHAAHAATRALDTEAEFCSARAKAECSEAVVSGCGLASAAACEGARTKSCLAAIPQGTKYQPSKAPACLSTVSAVYATSQITAAALASLDPVCGSDLFAGPGAARSPCLTDFDCDSARGLRCVLPNPPPADAMGQCFVPKVAPPGGDCSAQGSVCGPDTYCDPTGLTCLADAQLDDGCNPPYFPCATGLQCSAPGSPFATCEAASPDGTACTSSTACNSGLCDKATDQAGGTCASTISLTSLDSMCQIFQ